MQIPQDIQALMNDILTSYEMRIKEVSSLRESTFQLVEEVKKERSQLYDKLKEALAQGKSLRRKDFESMTLDIRREEEGKIEEIRDLVDIFQRQEELTRTRIVDLVERLDFADPDYVKDFVDHLRDHHETRELEIAKLLDDFKKEKDRVNESLKKFLGKGASFSIDDLKKMIREIRAKQQQTRHRNTEWMRKIMEERQRLEVQLKDIFRGLHAEQERMRREWRHMVASMKERVEATAGGGGQNG